MGVPEGARYFVIPPTSRPTGTTCTYALVGGIVITSTINCCTAAQQMWGFFFFSFWEWVWRRRDNRCEILETTAAAAAAATSSRDVSHIATTRTPVAHETLTYLIDTLTTP